MKIFIAKEYGTDLSSRSVASKLRRRIESEKTILDFTGVRTVSYSFASELIGVLIQKYGEDWMKENMLYENILPEVRISLLESVKQIDITSISELIVKKVISVELSACSNDEVMAYWRDANIGMCGVDIKDAVDGLKSCISSAFFKLREHSDDKLGPAMKKQKYVLLEHLRLV